MARFLTALDGLGIRGPQADEPARVHADVRRMVFSVQGNRAGRSIEERHGQPAIRAPANGAPPHDASFTSLRLKASKIAK